MSLGSTLCAVPGLAADLRPRESLVVSTCWRAMIMLWCLYLGDRRWYRVGIMVVDDEGKGQMEWRFQMRRGRKDDLENQQGSARSFIMPIASSEQRRVGPP